MQACEQEVSIGVVSLLWGWSSRRLSDWTQVTWKLVAENELEPRLLHILALTNAFAQVLQAGILPLLQTYVQTCHGLDLPLLRTVCWSLPRDKFILNLPKTLNFVLSSAFPSPPTCPICLSYLDSCALNHKTHIMSVVTPAFGRWLKAAGNKGISGTCAYV